MYVGTGREFPLERLGEFSNVLVVAAVLWSVSGGILFLRLDHLLFWFLPVRGGAFDEIRS